MDDRWWYTTTEASERLQLSPRMVKHMIKVGELPAYRVAERGHWRIRRQAVDALVAQWHSEAS